MATPLANTTQNLPNLTAKQIIWQLAYQHDLKHHQSQLDKLGDTISRLSDNELELDETQWLLVELGRTKVIIGREQIALNTRYMMETTDDVRPV